MKRRDVNEELQQFKDAHFETRLYQRRVIVAALFVCVLFCILVWRFYTLQIVHHQHFAEQADSNRIHVRPVPPNRGLIYDANGQLLADNRPTFTLEIIKEQVRDLDETLNQLRGLIAVTDADIETFRKLLRQRRRPYQPVPLRYRLSESEIARVSENEYRLDGISIQAELTRFYPHGKDFAHVIGYVGRINERELESFLPDDHRNYAGTNSIGKLGLEKYYESVLLGDVGYAYIEANAHGRVIRTLSRENPVPGKDLRLFIDADLQKAATAALGESRGSVVAIDVVTGGVLAMVSKPSFDANLFVTGISYDAYNALNSSRDLPLFNRAIQGQYPPGSTIKPVLGLGALEKGIVTPATQIFDPGYYQIENDVRRYRDWKRTGHGTKVDLHQAIVESCDVYFYELALNMGVDRIHATGNYFGLGTATNLDIPSERRGLWPSRTWKRETRNLPWFPGDSINISIGQGDVLTTPLQLASMTATLASRGTRIRPRLVASIDHVETELEVVEHFTAAPEHWDYVIHAMESVVHGARGTARAVGKGMQYKMAGKTGTAQVVGIAQDAEYDAEKLSEQNRDHAFFIAFAPVEQPKVALAVIVENGGSGSSVAAPVARKVLDAYFAGQARP